MISMEFLITSLILVLIPGTGVIYTISTGLFQGTRASFSAALGCTLGIVPSMLASIFGLTVILNTSALAFQVVKFVGVAYLLYLAWGMWRESAEFALEKTEDKQINLFQVALKGCLINVLTSKTDYLLLGVFTAIYSFKYQFDDQPNAIAWQYFYGNDAHCFHSIWRSRQ